MANCNNFLQETGSLKGGENIPACRVFAGLMSEEFFPFDDENTAECYSPSMDRCFPHSPNEVMTLWKRLNIKGSIYNDHDW
ncbi:hypothetical protein AB205_0187110 [Aquarana catesbeiana]|uniref:Uncharacterized protein n=1 Tax=Aquarana catesbeiana TaxID=8400 RepID=A0A2G9R3C5_AQUCT|nr:hypothetical protein AB205_0187110 [Aquarana catesbeiana]